MTRSGAEIIAESLKAHEVEHWFGMPAGHEILYLEVEKLGIDSVLIRDERNGAFMADGFSRASFKPGICTGGRMAAQYVASGMVEAYLSSIPVIAIISERGLSILDKNPWGGSNDLVSLFKTCTKWTHLAETADKVPDIMNKAFRVATTGRPGPVAVIVPGNVLEDEVDTELREESEYSNYPQLRIGPDPEMISKAAELLVKSERPVIVAGGGVMLSRAWSELMQLAELMMIPVATTTMGKGAIPDSHPLSIGVVGSLCGGEGGRGQIANEMVKEADVALLVGNNTDQDSTVNWTVPDPGARIIHIDIDPDEIGRNYHAEVGIAADAKLALKALENGVETKLSRETPRDRPKRVKEIQQSMKRWRDEISPLMNSETVPIKPQRVLKELQNFIDQDTIVVADAGTVSSWAGNYLDCDVAGKNFIAPRGLTALGGGYPIALGAKVGVPEKRVFSLHGDGAFGYSVMEIETAVRHNIPVVSLVFNNSSLFWEKWSAESKFGGEATGRIPFDFTDVNFGEIAKNMGCHGTRVERPEEIGDAIGQAVRSREPAIIDIVVDPQSIPPIG